MTDDPDDRHGRPPGEGPDDPPPPPANPDDRHGHPLSLHLRIEAGSPVGQVFRAHEAAVATAGDGLGFIVTQADGSTISVGPGEWVHLKTGDALRVVTVAKQLNGSRR